MTYNVFVIAAESM